MQSILDKAILASRWILAVFLIGLAAALALFALRFLMKVGKFATGVMTAPEEQVLLDLLHLLDWALVASLIVMVAVASWDSLVSPLSQGDDGKRFGWIRKLDPGNLKIKLAGSIVAISAIHLLQIYLRAEQHDDSTKFWAMAIHGLFLLGALMLALTDRIGVAAKAGKE